MDGRGAFPPGLALITPEETATALKVSPRTLAYWTDARRGRRPRLSFVKIGKTKRFVVQDVLNFIERQKLKAIE